MPENTFDSATTVYIGNYYEWHGTLADAVKYYYSGATRVAMRVGANAPMYLMGDHLGSTSVAVVKPGIPISSFYHPVIFCYACAIYWPEWRKL